MSERDVRAMRQNERGRDIGDPDEGSGNVEEVGPETPDADVVEQFAREGGDLPVTTPGPDRAGSDDVNEADAADQQRTVDLDEDDYR